MVKDPSGLATKSEGALGRDDGGDGVEVVLVVLVEEGEGVVWKGGRKVSFDSFELTLEPPKEDLQVLM